MTQNLYKNKSGFQRSVYRLVVWCLAQTFALFSLIYFSFSGKATTIFICALTLLLLCLPSLAEKIFRFRINAIVWTFCILYALGPMLGQAYKLFYVVTWWDDALHFCGGVVFAILGVFLAQLVNKENKTSLLSRALFALFFSIAVSAVWEFFEFGCDRLFNTDMQNDTVISFFDSYLLGATKGQTGRIENVREVIVNGVPLGVGGYIDIGLFDTISDMIIETLGALAYVVFYLIDKDRHPIFLPQDLTSKKRKQD